MHPDRLPPHLLWVLAGLAFAWGFNWPAMKVALSEVQPWTFRTLCLGLGSAVLFAALRAGGQPLAVPRGQWPRLAMLAFFNITAWNMLVAFGLTMISSSRAATVAFTMPAWAIPLSVWLLGEKLTRAKVLGLALAMAGIAILLAEGFSRIGEVPLGSFLILGASVCWAIGNVLQKRYPVSMPPGAYSAWLMLLGGVPIFLCSPFFEDPRAIATVGLWPALGVAYNVLVAFAFAHWAWFKISTTVPVSVSSLCTPVVPVVGILGGMVLLGERPSGAEYAAMALIIASLLTVVLPPLQRR